MREGHRQVGETLTIFCVLRISIVLIEYLASTIRRQ